MPNLIAPWYRHFARRVNRDDSFDSICTACCRTIARCRLYNDLERFEHSHTCPESDRGEARKPAASVRAVAASNLNLVA
jgi:hypothetical protein